MDEQLVNLSDNDGGGGSDIDKPEKSHHRIKQLHQPHIMPTPPSQPIAPPPPPLQPEPVEDEESENDEPTGITIHDYTI